MLASARSVVVIIIKISLLPAVFDSEAVCVTLLNFFTGILSGFAVFGFLGYLAWHMDTSVDDVVDSGMRKLAAEPIYTARHLSLIHI